MLQPLFSAGACAVGCVSCARLRPAMSPEQRQRAETQTPGLQSLLCAAFPYGPKAPAPGPISLYARGADYHAVLRERLSPAAAELARRFPGHRFDFYADSSPFPEVFAAALAGLGSVGQNGLLITPNAGSYVFLGFLATDASLPETGDGTVHPCPGCGACLRACPGGALPAPPDTERCLSALTQQRGALSEEQQALIRRGGSLWGCDRCQLVCPENHCRTVFSLPEFAPLPPPQDADLSLSDRAFRRAFAGRAFTWRGVQPLRRNHSLLTEAEPPAAERDPH